MKVKKELKGSLEYSLGMCMLILLTLTALFFLRLEVLQSAGILVEDSLAAANLASAVIDLEVYEGEEFAVITDCRKAYKSYYRALRKNMNLNEEMYPVEEIRFQGPVVPECYRIYNVYGSDIVMLEILSDGRVSERRFSDAVGRLTTPDGKIITNTTIYSCISFSVEGLKNQIQRVTKECSVDIAAEPEEKEDEKEKSL
ncbi:MAG: hypothetical protein ACI4DV_04030 [Lachnospiraceae bacterium]